LWRVPLGLLALCSLMALGEEAAREALSYAREPLARGELWRTVTAHVTHLGWPHLALNAVGLLGIWWSYARVLTPLRAVALCLSSALTISAGLYVFHPEVASYVGLSGVLHGVLVAAAILSVQTARPKWIEWVVIGGVWAKVAYEMFIGPIPLTQALSGGAVITASHFYGTLAGTLVGGLLTLRR